MPRVTPVRAGAAPGQNRFTVTPIATARAAAATACAGRGKKETDQLADSSRNGSIRVARPYQANSTAVPNVFAAIRKVVADDRAKAAPAEKK